MRSPYQLKPKKSLSRTLLAGLNLCRAISLGRIENSSGTSLKIDFCLLLQAKNSVTSGFAL